MTNETAIRRVLFPRIAVPTVLLIVIATTIIVGVLLAPREYRRFVTGYESFGATWQAHDMLLDYMTTNSDNWPTKWSDLEESFTRTNAGYGAPNLDWIARRILIDFSFNPSSTIDIAVMDQPSVIRLADGTLNGEVQNANQRIKEFVRLRRNRSR
jgi:hypothetical protein